MAFQIGQIVHLKGDVGLWRHRHQQGRRPLPLPLYRIYECSPICSPEHPRSLGVYSLERIDIRTDGARIGCQLSDPHLEECRLMRVFINKMRRKWRRV